MNIFLEHNYFMRICPKYHDLFIIITLSTHFMRLSVSRRIKAVRIYKRCRNKTSFSQDIFKIGICVVGPK